MNIIFGNDLPDYLLLSVKHFDFRYEEDFLKVFKYHLNNFEESGTVYNGVFFNDVKLLRDKQFRRFFRNENYNFEISVKEFIIPFKHYACYPIYILRNKKWWQCSPDSGYLMAPCEGRYADLTGVSRCPQ